MRTNNPYLRRQQLLKSGLIWCLFSLQFCAANAGPSCQRGCPQSDSGGILKFAPGTSYEYNFDSILTVTLGTAGAGASTDNDDTSLKVAGTAKLFAEGNCGYTLQLSAVRVSTTKEAVEKKILQSIQKPIHFTLVAGNLQPELCADANDDAYALNIKRALASLLATSTTDSQVEVDVFGHCPTQTTSNRVGNADIIRKVRNLNNCAYREQLNSGIINGIINDRAAVKSSLLLQADYTRESKLINGVVNNVELVEEYRFAGAVKGVPDVRAKVLTTLKIKNAAGVQAAVPATGNRGVNIIFQKPESYNVKNIGVLKTALTDLVQLESDFIKQGSARQFVEFIRLLRQADADTLLELSAVPLPNKVLARKVYLDALFRTGTAESAKAILKQLNKFEGKERIIALLSLNLVQIVDKDTINQAVTLLTPNAVKEVYLAVGNLVAKYCQRNSCEQADIEQISKRLTDNLKHCKANTKKDEERIVYILKGISNTQHLASSVSATLAECAGSGRANRIRIAALQAFAANSCDALLQRKALDLLRDVNEDAELRIEAYLAAIECATTEVANEIAEIVNQEQVQQVGGFIVSSLRAIRDSTDAKREQQRLVLSNVLVNKIFAKDFRRYSFNNELSYKLEALGLSASSDFKLIYSQHGFLPRSARWNVSTEIFGNNFNVFEASIRQENVENVLEYYLGPKGLLNRDFEEILQMVNPNAGGRARRSIADEATKFAKKYKTYAAKNVDDINLDLSLKLFGSELLFLSLGDHIPSSFDDIVKVLSEALEQVKKRASDFTREYTTHSLFLDVKVAYTTGVGIPLELSAQGLSTNKLNFALNVDIDALVSQNWQQSKYRLKVVPSVDAQLSAQLGFNAYVLSTGLRVQSDLQSATGADVKFELNNDGNGFNVDVELPRERLELLNARLSSDFYVAEQDKAVKAIALRANRKQQQQTPAADICFSQLEAVGLTICFASTAKELLDRQQQTAVSGSNNLLEELLQPFSLSLYIISERNYKFKAYHRETNIKSHQWRLDFSTPGSKVPHDTSVSLELSTTQRVFSRLSFENPQYRFAIELGIQNDDKELLLYAQYEDNNDVRKNKIGFVRSGNDYKPIIQIQDKNGVVNDINGYRADGKVQVQKTGDKQSRYTFQNFQVLNKNNERLVINGWADVAPGAFDSELRIAPGQQSYFIKSNLKLGANGEYSLGAFVNDEKTPQNVIGASALVRIADENWQLQVTGKALAWEVSGTHALQYQKTADAQSLATSRFNSELLVKHKNQLEGAFKINALTEGEKKLEADVAISRAQKQATLTFKLHRNQRAQQDYLLQLNAKFQKHFIDVLAKADLNPANNRFVLDNTIASSWGTTLTAKGELAQRFTPQDIYVDLQGAVQLTTKDKPTQWLLKIIGAPEKTNSELKVLRENAELLKFTAETQHPQDKTTAGKVNLLLKNVLNSRADFKIAKNGKGELQLHVETLKTEPKHKLEVASKFQILAPKYDVDVAVTLDGSKRLSVKTENLLDKSKFSSKNSLELEQQKFTLDAAGSVKGEWRLNGEILGNFALTLPDTRIIDGNFKRKVTSNPKTGIVQGNMELQLQEQQPAGTGGRKRSIVLNGKLEKLQLKAKEFAVENQFIYSNFDGKKLQVSSNLRHLRKAQQSNVKSLELLVNVAGELSNNQPIELALHVDEYSANHANYRVSGKYGNKASGNINGKYNTGVENNFELTANLQLPITNFKTLDLQTSGRFVRPNTDQQNDGAYLLELNIDERLGNQQFVRFNSKLQTSRQQGNYNLQLQSNQLQQGALKIDGSYQLERLADDGSNANAASGSQSYAFNFNYGNKFVKLSTNAKYTGLESGTLRYSLDSNYEAIKNLQVEVRAAKLPDESYLINVQGKQNADAYALESKFYQSNAKKGLDLSATLPGSDKTVLVVALFELLGERNAKWTVNVQNLIDLDLESSIEAAYKDIDDFSLTAQWNSRKLKLPNYTFDLRAQRKTINLNLRNAQGDILSGSATYALKREKQKSIIEGQGQVQYKGKAQQANFKLIRQLFDLQNDQEIGFSYTLNGNFAAKNAISTLKITNKDFNVKLSVCEERRQCTNLQIQSIISTTQQQSSQSQQLGLEPTQHSLLLLLDLRELGYPYEFELQSKTIRQGLKVQYNLDSNIKSQQNSYQLIINILPNSAKLLFKLPTRDIVFETQQQLPPQGTLFGRYEQSAAFYFDKSNHPKDVTRLLFSADISGVAQQALNALAELSFEHPKLRTLRVSGNLQANRAERLLNAELILDLFKSSEQKLIIRQQLQNSRDERGGFNVTFSEQINSNGLNIQYELNAHTALNLQKQEFSSGLNVNSATLDVKASAYIFGSLNQLEAEVYALQQQLARVSAQFNRQKYNVKVDTKLQVLANKPIEIVTEIQPTAAKIAIKRGQLLDANGDIKLGKEIKFNVIGGDKPLYNGRIALDAAHFLQTTYTSNEQDVQAWLSSVETEFKKDTESTRERVRNRFQKLRTEVEQQVKLARESVPDFSNLQANYEQHLNAIVKELENDADLKQLSETLQKIYAKLLQLERDISKIIADAYEKLHASLSSITEQVQVIIKDTIIPAWQELTEIVTKIIGELRIELVKAYTEIFQALLKVLEQYSPALKNYGKAITEALKPLYEITQEFWKKLAQTLEEIINDLLQAVGKLPTFEALQTELKEKLQQLKLAERVLELLNVIFEQLQLLPLSPEEEEFLQKWREYLEAKLRQQPINDEQVLGDLIQPFIAAVRAGWARWGIIFPQGAAAAQQQQGWSSLFLAPPFSTTALSKLPTLLTLRVSLINFILNENWQNIFSKDYFKSWILFQDFELNGHVADGRNFISFDGQLSSFVGTCKYILAQDSVDGNFTIIAQVNNGKLKSIILTDIDGNYLEVTDTAALKQNNNAVEYPLHAAGIHAWRKYYTVWLLSEYGVSIMCTTDLRVCHITVNGFYISKTRGLLGNGNAEPYDDNLLVDGSIATNAAALVNAYAIGKCAALPADAVQQQTTNNEHAEICTDLFGYESTLAVGYLFQNPAPYRAACDVSVKTANEKDKETIACNIATTYASALRLRQQYVVLPTQCLKCAGAAGQRDLGQEFTVKIPSNKADVVFVVDLGVSPTVLSKLIAPTITELRDGLSSRGLNDIQIGVVAYNSSQLYPAILSSDNGKLNYRGNIADAGVDGPKQLCDNCISQVITEKKILDAFTVIEKLINSIVPQADEKAFRLALRYPFRAAAAKSIIGVRSESLGYGNWLQILRAQISEATTPFDAALLHLIAPVTDLALEGVPAEKLVGFNSRLVATLDTKDAKKRQKLVFQNDLGIDTILNTNGWVFNTQHFDTLRAPEQKKFLNQVTSSIADSLFKTEIVSDCKCAPVSGLHAQHKCTVKSSNFVPNKKPKAAA